MQFIRTMYDNNAIEAATRLFKKMTHLDLQREMQDLPLRLHLHVVITLCERLTYLDQVEDIAIHAAISLCKAIELEALSSGLG